MVNAMVTTPPGGLKPQGLREMAARYGLTAAEVEVTGLLAQGDSLSAIAASTGRTRETVRTHLKSIFMKTGTHRQVELVILANASLNRLC